MGDFFGSVWWLIVALGILVTFHEFGHFWVARRCGVKVLRFSVGFGSPLWKRVGADGCEYVVAGIPLGGYVKMLDEREGQVAPHLLNQAFTQKSLAQRTAIIAAGPVFNLVFALFAFWLMFVIGVTDVRPLLGQPDGIAADAGFQKGDLITAVDGESTPTWGDAGVALLLRAYDGELVDITVQSERGTEQRRQLDLSKLGDFDETRLLDEIGLEFYSFPVPPRIREFSPTSPVQSAGLREGDLIVRVDGKPVADLLQLRDILDELPELAPAMAVIAQRGDEQIEVQLKPHWDKQEKRYLLGFRPAQPELTADQQKQIERAQIVRRYGPIEAIGPAFNQTVKSTVATGQLLGRLITGDASLRNLQGPIGIAQYANQAAQRGVERFLQFLGFISLNLAIINFLPIPMLDGGHLLYNLIEFLKGSPVSERVQLTGQYIGIFLLIGLMGLAISNDILRLVG